MAEGMAGLSLGDRAEQGGHVRVALDVGLLGEVEVAAVGLALAGERLLEVGLGLAVFQFWHGVPFMVVGRWRSTDRRSFWLGRSAARGPRSGARATPAAACRRLRHSGHRPRKTISAEPTSKPRSAPSGTASSGKSATRSRTLPHCRQTRWWWGSSTLGSNRVHPGAHVERGDLAQLGEVVEGLVHRLEGDGLHLAAGGRVHRLGRRVGLVALQHPEDALALGGDLATGGPEQLGQLVGRLHRAHVITNDCSSTIVVEICGPEPPSPPRSGREARRSTCGRLWPCPIAPAPPSRAGRFRRDGALARLATERFDVLVIGGGITGAGVALDAASRGLRTALVEKDDFASGTSSKSSKLIHGGLRYLQQHEYRLVYENLAERQRLLDNAPHLVSPLPFLIPLFGKYGVVNRAWPGSTGPPCGSTT